MLLLESSIFGLEREVYFERHDLCCGFACRFGCHLEIWQVVKDVLHDCRESVHGIIVMQGLILGDDGVDGVVSGKGHPQKVDLVSFSGRLSARGTAVASWICASRISWLMPIALTFSP